MKSKWKVHVPVDQRPSKPEHNLNWQNFIGVILRDAGKVAIIDGDTKEKIAKALPGKIKDRKFPLIHNLPIFE